MLRQYRHIVSGNPSKLHALGTPAVHFTQDGCLADIEGEGNIEVALNGLFRLLVGGMAVEIVERARAPKRLQSPHTAFLQVLQSDGKDSP